MNAAGTYNQEQRCPKYSHFLTNIKLVCDLLLGAANDTAGILETILIVPSLTELFLFGDIGDTQTSDLGIRIVSVSHL